MKILLQAMNVNGKYWKYLLMILNVTTNAKVIYSWTFFTSNERHIGVGESILTKMKRIWIQMNVNEHQKVYLSAFSCMSVENLINVCVIYDRRKSIATSKPILEFKTVKLKTDKALCHRFTSFLIKWKYIISDKILFYQMQ